ncbi:hypothetical protein C7B65_09445 [Phormidesmis priestleyi ULC007]|uniref:Pycsar effector protein domain-containing protein n=1 Tax=Phormidesmis priestleyi ULC007 TaxID=1920490 RepID=A0A2T1DHD2_9CYAN|nr:hypothetical protein [Phormidesmis priestleyi]PSB19888.1 hypothetical protein C7B65_09445 [Phormidesmis priestleyi ULC007]PZO49215.1 MAG: hypothetical protein DCF14_14845 [Phormidesmis priestleyi]
MEVTEKLLSIFQITNDWLKFAEAKNAVLLAFSGTGVTVIVTYLSAASNVPNSLQQGSSISMSLLFISALISSLSFLPKTDLERIVWLMSKPSRRVKHGLKDTDNFYFFNDLKKYQPVELLSSMNRLYFDDQIKLPFRKEDLDVVSQTIVNSEIASIKFKFFTASLSILILSFFVTPISLLISLLLYRSL